MLISERQAAERLAAIGMPRRQARLALAAGLAGTPTRTRAATLYDDERVDMLVTRPIVPAAEVVRASPYGIFLDRRVTHVQHLDELATAEVEGLRLGAWGGALMSITTGAATPLPYVATVCGFVVLGAEIVGVRAGTDDRYRLELTAPGQWYETWRGGRFPTGPGREWSLLGRHQGMGVAVGQ